MAVKVHYIISSSLRYESGFPIGRNEEFRKRVVETWWKIHQDLVERYELHYLRGEFL